MVILDEVKRRLSELAPEVTDLHDALAIERSRVRLEELEQERMPYFAVKKAKNHPVEESMLENRWHYIVSGCCLMDTI